MADKPDVLLIESSVQAIDKPRRQRLVEKYNLIQYDCDSVEEFVERMKPGGPYSTIQAIVRLGWHKVGSFANLRPFATEVVAHYPPSLKIVSCSGHGYDAADIVAMAERGISRSHHAIFGLEQRYFVPRCDRLSFRRRVGYHT